MYDENSSEEINGFYLLKKSMNEAFNRDVNECSDLNKKIKDLFLNNNRNENFNSNEKIIEFKKNLIDGIKMFI